MKICAECGEEREDIDFPDQSNVCISCKVSGQIKRAKEVYQTIQGEY